MFPSHDRTGGDQGIKIQAESSNIVIEVFEGSGGFQNTFTYNSAFAANVWKHYTVVIDKNLTNNLVLYIDGVLVSPNVIDKVTSGTLRSIGQVFIVDQGGTSALFETQGSLQDFVIWNTDLTNEDARVLYNSGSWLDIHQHASASLIWDWWLFGQESNIGQTSGSALSSGTAVTSTDRDWETLAC